MVKKSLVLLTAITLWLATSAQHTIKEGKVLYSISYQNLPLELRKNEHMLPHDASFYFKGENTRMEMGVMGMGKNTTIYRGDSAKNIVLLNLKGRKYALVKSDSEMVEVKKSLTPNDSDYSFLGVTILDEFKKIANLNCQKALIKRKIRGQIIENECWFTREIPPYNTKNDSNLSKIPGFLMQYMMVENGVSMTMTVKLVMPSPIENNMFEIPVGYQIVTEKDLERLLKVMQSDY